MDSLSWKIFESINPSFATRLSCYDEESLGVSIVQTEIGEENILDVRKSEPRFFHDQKGAFLEARNWVAQSLKDIDEKIDVLVVYGIGMGWYWKALIPWLERKKQRRIIFIEDDFAVVSCFLKSTIADAFFQHPQTSLIAIEGVDDKESFDLLVWNLFRKKWKWLVSAVYSRYRPKASSIISETLQVTFNDTELVADEFSTFGATHARNLLRNLFVLNRSLNGADLFGTCQGVPIVVVAAGPSLQDALPFIQKISDRAIILSGGSSTNALLDGGIIPHFAATVDPNPMQYSRLKYIEPFALPLFFRSRALNEAVLASGANPLIYLKGGDGYPLVSYFEEALEIEGPVIDGGDSVSSLLIELAVALGASTIIMVGYDLAYTGGKRYSQTLQNTLHASENIAFTQTEHGASSFEKDSTIVVAANNGQTVISEMKWVTEAKWITKYYETIKDSIALFNTAPGGMAISGVPYHHLEDVYDFYFKNREDALMPMHILQKVMDILARAPSIGDKASCIRISQALENMSQGISDLEEMVKKLQAKLVAIPFEIIMNDTECIELLCNIESAFAMESLFKPFWQMHEKWMLMRKRLEIKGVSDQCKQQEVDFEQKSLKDRLEFINDGIAFYKKLFFSGVSWAFLQGEFLENPYAIAPWPDGESKNELTLF